MFCSKCGYKSSDEAAFCQKCGEKFFVDDTVRQPLDQQPINQVTALPTAGRTGSLIGKKILGLAVGAVVGVVTVSYVFQDKATVGMGIIGFIVGGIIGVVVAKKASSK